MTFSELDLKMRVYETAHDLCVLPEVFMAARIDGLNFTRLTKETHAFESPFDLRVRDMMTSTTEHLMTCGFRAVYGYTQSNEISILFHRQESAFGRKVRKFNSILAGEASASFSLLLGSSGGPRDRTTCKPTPTTQTSTSAACWPSSIAISDDRLAAPLGITPIMARPNPGGPAQEVIPMAHVETGPKDYGAFGGWLIGAILIAGVLWWLFSAI